MTTTVEAPLPQQPDIPRSLRMGRPGLSELEATVLAAEERLRQGVTELRARYQAGRPYPHLVLDGLFDPHVLDRVVEEWPAPTQRGDAWVVWRTPNEDKTTSRGLLGAPRFAQLLLLLLNSPRFVEAVGAITGMDDLVPDPLLFGAGLQDAGRGGWLGVHSDYLRHPQLSLHRRLNLLLYLNRGWDPTWGGDLELWDRAGPTRQASYEPLFNRLVLFPTTPDALHGHPVRLSCPASQRRRLISLYYWSVLAPHAPPEAGPLSRLARRARRAARRVAVRLRWRGPRFYETPGR